MSKEKNPPIVTDIPAAIELKDMERDQQEQQDASPSAIQEPTSHVKFESKQHPERLTHQESMYEQAPSKVNVTFEGLYYGVKVGKGRKKTTKWLLTDVTGSIQPGHLTALMGPSGAGKSTLLDVLAGRKSEGILEGDLLFNGRERTIEMKRFFGYVEQKDILLPTLTVREILTFTARLRMTRQEGQKNVISNDHSKRVQEVVDMLGIDVCADTIIGDVNTRGISGGQAKRVSAAMELITNPSILFLDEPTSGLDSQTSLDFIKVIRKLCKTGVTIICTIHQPSSDVFEHFDRLLLLVAGEVVYLGPSGDSPSYFVNKGFPMPIDMNPADYLVAVTSGSKPPIDTPEINAWLNVDVRYFIEEYKKDAISEMRKVSTKRVRAAGEQVVLKKDFPRYANGFFYNIKILYERVSKKSYRDPNFFYKRVIQILITSLIFMTVYLNSPYDLQGVRNRQSLIMLCLIFFTVGAGSYVGPIFEERHFIARELNAGSYPVGCVYIANFLFEFPWNIIKGLIWLIVLYFAVGFHLTAQSIIFFLIMTIVMIDFGIAMATFFAYLAPTKDLAAAIMASVPVLFIMFSGFFIKKDEIPDYWIWVYYIAYTNYGLTGYIINEFEDNYQYYGEFCDTNLPNGTYTENCVTVPLDPDWILNWIGLSTTGFFSNRWANFMMVAIIWMLTRIAGFLALKYIKHGRA